MAVAPAQGTTGNAAQPMFTRNSADDSIELKIEKSLMEWKRSSQSIREQYKEEVGRLHALSAQTPNTQRVVEDYVEVIALFSENIHKGNRILTSALNSGKAIGGRGAIRHNRRERKARKLEKRKRKIRQSLAISETLPPIGEDMESLVSMPQYNPFFKTKRKSKALKSQVITILPEPRVSTEARKADALVEPLQESMRRFQFRFYPRTSY